MTGHDTPFRLPCRLGYAMADFNVSDAYLFSLALREDGGLDVAFESSGGNDTFVVDATALDGAQKMLDIAQGSVTDTYKSLREGARTTEAVPPFLLSRKAFAAVRAGEPVLWKVGGGGEEEELELVGTGVVALERDGATVSFPCVKLLGDDVSLWVIDDPEWPWVLRAYTAGGDNYWIALAAGESLDLARVDVLGSSAALDEPEATPLPRKGESAAELLSALSGSQTKLLLAVEECALLSDAASREALMTASASGLPRVGGAAQMALKARSSEPGFAEAAYSRIEAAIRDVAADEPNASPKMHLAMLLGQRLLTAEHLRVHPPLAPLLRRTAIEHPSAELRWIMRWYLASHLADPEFGDHLVASTDQRALAEDMNLCRAWGTVLPRHRPPLEAVETIRRLTAKLPPAHAEQAISAFLYGTDVSDVRWIPPLLEWLRAAAPALQEKIASRLYSMPWGELGDPSNEADMDSLVALYRELEPRFGGLSIQIRQRLEALGRDLSRPLVPAGPFAVDDLWPFLQSIGTTGGTPDFETMTLRFTNSRGDVVAKGKMRACVVVMGPLWKRAFTFDRYTEDQRVGPLGDDDPPEGQGDDEAAMRHAAAIAARAGASFLYPDPMGSVYVAIFDFQAVSPPTA